MVPFLSFADVSIVFIGKHDFWNKIIDVDPATNKPRILQPNHQQFLACAYFSDSSLVSGAKLYEIEALIENAIQNPVWMKGMAAFASRVLQQDRVRKFLEFHFSENEYFTPLTLTKTFFFNNETNEVEKSQGCSINWTSQDKNPRVEVKTKKVKKGKNIETKKVESIVESFFDIFADQASDDLNLSDQVNFWKDDFFANSLEYYLNIIDVEEDIPDDEEDEDPENDDDEEEDGGKKKKTKTKGGADKNEKCKNQ